MTVDALFFRCIICNVVAGGYGGRGSRVSRNAGMYAILLEGKRAGCVEGARIVALWIVCENLAE